MVLEVGVWARSLSAGLIGGEGVDRLVLEIPQLPRSHELFAQRQGSMLPTDGVRDDPKYRIARGPEVEGEEDEGNIEMAGVRSPVEEEGCGEFSSAKCPLCCA
jgi:hypothetical protein